MCGGRKKRKFRQLWSGNLECRAGFPAPTTVGRTLVIHVAPPSLILSHHDQYYWWMLHFVTAEPSEKLHAVVVVHKVRS